MNSIKGLIQSSNQEDKTFYEQNLLQLCIKENIQTYLTTKSLSFEDTLVYLFIGINFFTFDDEHLRSLKFYLRRNFNISIKDERLNTTLNWVMELTAKIIFNVICVKLSKSEEVEGPKLE